MTEDYMEDFRRVEASMVSDGMGGTAVTVTEGETFPGALYLHSAAAMEPGGQYAALVSGRLYHARAVRFRPGQLVRRVKDGAVYRAVSEEVPAPARCGLDLAYTPVERLVTSVDGNGTALV